LLLVVSLEPSVSLAPQIIDQRVNGLISEKDQFLEVDLKIGNDLPKRRSAAFTYLTAKTVLGLADEAVEEGVVDGGNDFGVDALYFDPPADGEILITVIQAKYKASLEGNANFPENGVQKMVDAIGALFDPSRTLALNDRLLKRVEEIRSFVASGAIPRVVAIAANNGLSWSEVAQDRIDASGFGDQVTWRHVGPDELLGLLQAQKPIDTQLQLTGAAVVEPFAFRRVLIGRMAVSELARLADTFGDRLLERNIRRYLGLSGNRVNEAIAQTLQQADQRPNFYFYNNGVTITCAQFRHNALQQGNWTVQVSGLQIVNGGQTCRTVQQVAKQMGAAATDAFVLVRIYELQTNDDDLVSSITYATNSQNPVDLRDLKANDPRQKALSDSIQGLGYAYRAKREERATTSDELTSAVVAEAILAVWRRRPHQARFLSREHFGALYDIIFDSGLNGAQAVTAALLLRLAENRRKRPPSDAPDFLAYGSRFVAMMMGKYLLESLGIELEALDHRTFPKAKELIDAQGDAFLERAEQEIAAALDPLFSGRERTLQRLSATFRRADLVEMLFGTSLSGAIAE